MAGDRAWSEFDSHRVPVASRTPLWAESTARYLVPLALELASPSLMGSIAGRQRGSVKFCRLSASAHYGVRTREAASGVGADHYKLAVALRGTVGVHQYGRTATLRPGECAVYDTSDEYRVGSDGPFSVFIVLVPRDALAIRASSVTALAARRLPVAESDPVRDLMLAAAGGRGGLNDALEALGTLLGNVRAPSPEWTAPDAELRQLAIALIEERLADRRLGPDYLGAVLGVSRRRLYRTFEREPGPIAAYIRDRRMARARAVLADPDQAELAVSEVALECGFADAAHFSRLFSSAHGRSPRRYRQEALET